MSRPVPIVEYAREIGKNTADFTISDMIKFTRKWMKQPVRKDLLMTPEQRKEYNNDVNKVKDYFKRNPKVAEEIRGKINNYLNKGDNKMGKIVHKSKQVQAPVEVEEQEVFQDEEGNLVDAEGNLIDREEEVEEEVEVNEEQQEENQDEEVALQMGLSAQDVEALKWVIGQVNEDYDMSEHEYGTALNGIKEVLDTVE